MLSQCGFRRSELWRGVITWRCLTLGVTSCTGTYGGLAVVITEVPSQDAATEHPTTNGRMRILDGRMRSGQMFQQLMTGESGSADELCS